MNLEKKKLSTLKNVTYGTDLWYEIFGNGEKMDSCR